LSDISGSEMKQKSRHIW